MAGRLVRPAGHLASERGTGVAAAAVPISAVAAVGAVVPLAVAARGPAIDTRKVLRGAPWQIVVFSLGMYLVVYGLRSVGLTHRIARSAQCPP